MAIPQINQITSVLRDMPDAQLQQYAAMHKSDPYVLSLAVAESNARKQLRASQQAKMAGQKPPTVVEQDLMAMAPQPQLPEQQGIGALPAPNMQRMADGGIAGYDEGGTTEQSSDGHLAYSNEPVMRMAEGGIARFADKGQVKGDTGYWDPNTGEYVIGEDVPQQSFSEKFWKSVGYGKGLNIDPRGGLAEPKTKKGRSKASIERDAAMAEVYGTGRTQPAMANDPRLPANYQPQAIKDQEGAKPATALEKATADNAAAAAARTPAGPAGGGFPSTLGQFTPSTPDELAAQAEKVAATRQTESDAAYKPYAEMLQKERADLEGRKEGNLKDAMLRAGLAMMAGKSQHALQNIGEGGIQGVNAYQESKRADDAAKKALMGSEIALMQAQRAERSGNHKDAIALMGQAQQQKEFGVTAAMKAQELKQTGEYYRMMGGAAVARANALGARDNDLAKARAEYGKIQAKVMSTLKDDMTYAALPDDKKEAYRTRLLRSEMMNNPFLSSYAAGIGFAQGPSAGSVERDYTEGQ